MQLVEVPTSGFHTLPGCADLLDLEHPDHLDWRQVRLSVDRVEGRWLHFSVEPKTQGRAAADVVDSDIFRLCIDELAGQLFKRMHGTWPKGFSKMRVGGFLLESGQRCVSLHADAKTQNIIRGYSQHDLLRLTEHWSQVCADKARLRAAGAR